MSDHLSEVDSIRFYVILESRIENRGSSIPVCDSRFSESFFILLGSILDSLTRLDSRVDSRVDSRFPIPTGPESPTLSRNNIE